jgi:hypothetical protein
MAKEPAAQIGWRRPAGVASLLEVLTAFVQ